MDLEHSAATLQPHHAKMAAALRLLSADAIEKAQSGHPGMALGFADVLTVLYTDFLKFHPDDPTWHDRDRLILSAGHGVVAQYAALYLTGYKDFHLEELRALRQLNSKTPGHPELDQTPGIEITTGPLGQGLANAVGMAVAEKKMRERFGIDFVNHKIYAVVGDGCLMEGISHEASSLAGHLVLNNLIVLFDDNGISIDGSTRLTVSEETQKRFTSYGWKTYAVDGHNAKEIRHALHLAQQADRPVLIACRTLIACGAGKKQGSHTAHGSPLGTESMQELRRNLKLSSEAFSVPPEILKLWRQTPQRCSPDYQRWQTHYKNSAQKQRFENAMKGHLPETLGRSFSTLKRESLLTQEPEATRVSSRRVIEKIIRFIPECLGGSADLSESNGMMTPFTTIFDAQNAAGNYLHYGIREHAMAAMMNGLSVHGGILPYGGTFFVFSDYMKPAIRMSALLKRRVIYIMTHDSIGVGEDGPTHQPVEHLPALRAIPHLQVFRPADKIETLEAWQVSLQTTDKPSVLVLTRQKVEQVRTCFSEQNLSSKGAYFLKHTESPVIKIFATGSEVSLALSCARQLEARQLSTAVVSFPSWDCFERQTPDYRATILKPGTLNVAIEASVRLGWDRYIGANGLFIGLDSFGVSAPGNVVYQHFGLTTDAICRRIVERLIDLGTLSS